MPRRILLEPDTDLYLHQRSRHSEFVQLMRAAGVLVRDRSSDPGCDGRVRITIGTREQMKQAAVALKEALAALRSGGETR
jgi:histidinol-phosphate aminotransferase